MIDINQEPIEVPGISFQIVDSSMKLLYPVYYENFVLLSEFIRKRNHLLGLLPDMQGIREEESRLIADFEFCGVQAMYNEIKRLRKIIEDADLESK